MVPDVNRVTSHQKLLRHTLCVLCATVVILLLEQTRKSEVYLPISQLYRIVELLA